MHNEGLRDTDRMMWQPNKFQTELQVHLNKLECHGKVHLFQ